MSTRGRVVSLHLHPENGGEPMIPVREFELEAGRGIVQDVRYFGRRSRDGSPSRRQVTLIEREQIDDHAAALGLPEIAEGQVRANIETEGIELVALTGKQIRIGSAVLLIGKPRDPCEKMDRIAPGLKELMNHGKQGVLAQVAASGKICVGSSIEILE